MRETAASFNAIKYIGLAATLLLLGLFFRWNLNQTLTVYASTSFRSSQESSAYAVQGTGIWPANESEGGSVYDSDTGMILYYLIDDGEAYISGYDSSGISTSSVSLYLPGYIVHGDGSESGDGETYAVVGVAASVFSGFSYLTSVVVPSGYEYIGAQAFSGCPLTGVTINATSSLTEIRERAFYSCTKLTSVTIPASVTSVGVGAFANCTQLTSISVTTGNSSYCADNGVLYSYDRTVLVQWPAGLSVGSSTVGIYYIGSEDYPVKVIYDRAFEGCTFLYQITGMYDTVTTIGQYAFYNCSNLYLVKIPTSVTTIGNYAFTGCSSSLVIECYKASYAETWATAYGISTTVTCVVNFYNGTTLVKTEEVVVGSSATAPTLEEQSGYTLTWDKDYTNVQQNLNVYATWLKNYTVTFQDSYSGQVTELSTYYGASVTPPTWTRSGYTLAWDTTEYTYVTSDLTVNAVWLVSLTDGTITDDTPQVGDTRTINYITYQVTRATASDPRVKAVGCTKTTLTSLVIPDTVTFGGVTYKVTNIGARAFRGMSKLTTLEIGKNVIKINRAAFYNCPKLKKITIHSKKLTGVSVRAFSKTYVKAQVNVPNAYIKKYTKLLQDGGLSTYATVY